MMAGVQCAGLPDKDQTRGMVTSLWVCFDCFGGYIRAMADSAVFEQIGFEFSTRLMALTVLLVVMIIVISTLCANFRNL